MYSGISLLSSQFGLIKAMFSFSNHLTIVTCKSFIINNSNMIEALTVEGSIRWV